MEGVLEDDLTCAVCLCLYQDPVSLSCGHSFCRVCIKKAILGQEGKCPLCQTALSRPLELKKNVNLASIVETFKAKEPQAPAKSTPSIPCDNCLEPDKAAVRTCLNCEVSLCPLHLEKHNAKPAFKDHVLLAPTSTMEGRKCPLHDRLLECYCQDDKACICMMCSIAGPHKGHSITTLKEEHQRMLAILSHNLKTQKSNVSAMEDGLKNLQMNQESIQRNSAHLVNELASLFKNIHLQVDKLQKEMMDAVTSNEVKQLLEIKNTMVQMDNKKIEILQNMDELLALKRETDSTFFIKAFVSAEKRFKKQDLNTRIVQVADVKVNPSVKKKITAKTSDYLASVKAFLKPLQGEIINQIKWFSATPADGKLVSCNEWDQTFGNQKKNPFTFEDMQSFDYDCDHPWSEKNSSVIVYPTFRRDLQDPSFIISKNQKSLTRNGKIRLKQFAICPPVFPAILCSESYSSGRYFWDVDTSQSSSWSVGVTTLPNSGPYRVPHSSWYIQWDGCKMSCFPSQPRPVYIDSPPKRIRVQLNFDEKSMYFYDASHYSRAQHVLLCKYNTPSTAVCPGFDIIEGTLTLA